MSELDLNNKEKRKQYYLNNRDKILQRNKQYYYDNKEEKQAYSNEYWALHGHKYIEERKKKRYDKRYNKAFKFVPNIIVTFN
jgi:hypothetical protein